MRLIRSILKPFANPELEGLMPDERLAVLRPLGGAVLALQPFMVLIVVVLILIGGWGAVSSPAERSIVKSCVGSAFYVALLLGGWLLGVRELRKRVRKVLDEHPCSSCGTSLVGATSRPGELICSCGRSTPCDVLVRAMPVQAGSLQVLPGRGCGWWRRMPEHRLYQELTSFDDDRAAVLFAEAKEWAMPGLGYRQIFVAACCWLLALAMGVIPVIFIKRLFEDRLPELDARHPWVSNAVLIVPLTITAIVVMKLFFGWTRANTARAVRRRLQLSECGRCGYSLVTAPRLSGAGDKARSSHAEITCPECGARTPVTEKPAVDLGWDQHSAS